ncbi:hypothetical protein Tdes44962_MAKER08934 [Teratosphaeria destructans]|uniref:Uncharacterized protein n=1 Tax=Teratosphaeria destructans TaxID=418781 RepID=A0A9W7SUL4_9PEZI|nr:hypothetical protein Tdes44962_MAKER08934 [Teratosphaeria destructans]
MGVDTRRPPPLPAPTESMDESTGADTEVATNVTTQTDRTSYEIPEDGSPITISTHKVTSGKEGGRPGHSRQKSQTSLLIEYFEASKSGDKSKSRPSVRVKVTPGSNKRINGHDAIRVTSIGKDRKPSYSRRISLGGSRNVDTGPGPIESTEISHSSESNVSGRSPLEIEVMNNESEISGTGKSSRGLLYAHNDSTVSSMPPDSMLEGSGLNGSEVSRDIDADDESTVTDANYLKAPIRPRSRSTSRDRITQKVMEKLGQTSGKSRKSTSERGIHEQYDAEGYPIKEKRRRSSKSHRADGESVSGAESSLLSSSLSPSQVSQRSYRSGTSQGSRMTNNPKLLEMVEDTIKRMILPEINAIKEDQQGRRGSKSGDVHEESDLKRRISKSTSSPNITSKPKVVLNRDGDDPGTVLSRGDSEYKKKRRSSRGSHTEERPSSRRSSGRHSSHSFRDAAELAGGALTAAALKHHESQSDMQERKERRRAKSRSSRSRSTSIAETNDEAYGKREKEEIPPLPLASAIHDSDVTRDSIVSSAAERPESRASADAQTLVRDVSRKSIGEAMSPVSSRTPTRTPVPGHRGLGMSHGNQSIESPRSPNAGISTKARRAALAAAGLSAAAVSRDHDDQGRHVDADGYGEYTSQRSLATASPAQSVTSLKKQFEDDPLVPDGLCTKSAASKASAGRLGEVGQSETSLKSPRSSPTTQRLAHSRQQSHSQGLSGDVFATPLERPNADYMRESTPGTPNGESIDDWYERQHELNNRYRDSMDESQATNRDSYQTNPFPEDDKRFTQYTDDSFNSIGLHTEQDVNKLGANPMFGSPTGAESHVASLIEPSTMSSNARSSYTHSTTSKTNGSFADRVRELNKGDTSPAVYEGSTLSQSMPSQDRWAAIRGHARNLSANTSQENIDSPRQNPAKSLRQETSTDSVPVMGASSLPLAGDPMPEAGHFDDTKSDISTNPSIIKGPLGGDATGKTTWPYTPEPHDKERNGRDSQSLHNGHSKEQGLLAAAAGGAAVLAAKRSAKQPQVADEDDEEERAITPDLRLAGTKIDRGATPTSPAAFRDEGYVTDAHARSAGAHTPRADQRYAKAGLQQHDRAIGAQATSGDDPFNGNIPTANSKHARHMSGNSHGMTSPLYDSATGQGVEHIQSKDIVALMDHLTVRDAQRNARDTEILVTLVRSATEMRQSFDDMKRFIAEQDRLIMQNTDRNAEQTLQKVLGGPRPQPCSAPRTPRRESDEQIQEKRKGVLRRALKGLTGGRRSDDLARVEDMLMQILDNVEDLKQGGMTTGSRQPLSSYTSDTLDSYEKLRAAPDSGYEPDGQAGTSSTPSHSGHFTGPPSNRPEERQFHSGYDGRRGSFNRVSTVLEGDEDEQDELTPDEDYLLKHQFENNQRMLTPTQELKPRNGTSPTATPPQGGASSRIQSQDLTPKAAEKQQKRKSNSSSIFGVPKISRWSKTTSSSVAPDPATIDSPDDSRGFRPQSLASRSESQLGDYDDDEYEHDDHRLRSTSSLPRDSLARPVSGAETRSMRSQGSQLTRTPSPLIPSEASARLHDDDYSRSPVQEDDGEFDDPKYQAVRNSLLLEHPQPRQGTTSRHQSNLETKAHDYDDPSTSSDLSQRTVSDFDPAMWGSSGTAALARNRMSNTGETMSPVSPSKRGNDGPLIPRPQQKQMPKVHEPETEQDWEPQYSNSGFSRGGSYTSPFGSGHLLEPIEEVRYSLETDSGHVSLEPQLASAQAVDLRSSGRKITGPRPMGSRSPNPETQARLVDNSGTVRRKPVGSRTELRGSY